MKTAFLLVFFTVMVALAEARRCPYSCTKRTCRGWGWWKRCSNKRITCYKDCVDGGWTPFRVINRGPCSVTCGGGRRTVTKTRTCTNPTPKNGGRACSGSSRVTYSETCRVARCPKDGRWTAFKVINRGPCSVTCGGGRRTVIKTRSCTNPTPQNGGRACSGSSRVTSSETCKTAPCPPVAGGWTQYQTVSRATCSVTCGNGTRNVTQTRQCTNPAPQHGGANCQGQASRQVTEPCTKAPCPDVPTCTEGGKTYLPAKDRHHFYQCDNGTAILRKCPVGTKWNQSATVCGFETRSSATPSSVPSNTATTPAATTVSTSASCVEGSRVPLSGDCRYFSWCVNGRSITMSCAPGTLFDVKTRRCENSANVQCGLDG